MMRPPTSPQMRRHARRLAKTAKAAQPIVQPVRWAWGDIASVVSANSYTVYLEGVRDPGTDLPCYAGSHLPAMNPGDVVELKIADNGRISIFTSYPQS